MLITDWYCNTMLITLQKKTIKIKWKHEKLILQSKEYFGQISGIKKKSVLEGIAQAYYQQFASKITPQN